MPRPRTGELYRSRGVWYARISVVESGARVRRRVPLDTDVKAVAQRKLDALLETGRPTLPTFRELGDRWTSGELAQEYPDHVRPKRTARHDAYKLARHVYPHIGDLPLDAITIDAVEAAMRGIPKTAARSRNHIAGTIARLLKVAVFPMRLIERSPLPPGFVPKRPTRKAMAWLYPDEDARLLAAAAVPLEWRMLWGFLMREGLRTSEACGLTWGDVDLRRGMVRLDRNKTDDPRSWALDAGVRSALQRWGALRAEPAGALVFVRPDGVPHKAPDLAIVLREHLRAIGLEAERPELFESSAERQQIRAHDLRGTFVTVSLAQGKSEAWISDRTGHRSSLMIARYKRTARSFAELELGGLASLDSVVWATKGPERPET